MAKSVGVRELRARASSILRRVREKNETFDVTYHGSVIARIVPVIPLEGTGEARTAAWTDLDRLASEIGKHWEGGGKSAAEIVSEGRR